MATHSKAVQEQIDQGYMTENMIINSLGHKGIKLDKRRKLIASFGPPCKVVNNEKLWGCSLMLEIMRTEKKERPEKKERVIQSMEFRFMVGEFLPDGYIYRPYRHRQ